MCCVCVQVTNMTLVSHLYSHSSGALLLSFPPHCQSPSCFEWQEERLQPDSYYVVWALAPTRLPRDHQVALSQCLACSEETSRRWWLSGERERERGEKEKREGGRSLGAVFHDVVPPIVLSVRLSLIVRPFPSPMPFMPLHQSTSQTFDLQFKAVPVRIYMLMYYSPKLCVTNHK